MYGLAMAERDVLHESSDGSVVVYRETADERAARLAQAAANHGLHLTVEQRHAVEIATQRQP
jgi:hypothetical protein